MVAPELYLNSEKDARVYDAILSYEEISEWFNAQRKRDSRYAYKSYLIKEAIEQNRRGYTVKPDDRVTDFYAKYWRLATQKYPELEMKKPGIKPALSDWPDFHPSALSKNFSIVHKLAQGDVDLQIAGAAKRIAELKEKLKELDLQIVKASKSAAVRIKVEPIDRFSSFESQRNLAENGLHAAMKLLNIGSNIADIINESIKQKGRKYIMKPDDRVTDFYAKYWLLADQKYPALEMKKPGLKPANSDWPYFHPSVLGRGFVIVHKLARGDVDLQVAGAANRIDELKKKLKGLDVDVVKAGKSAAIRLKVKPIDRFSSFESQEKIVEKGLKAAIRLVKIGNKISDKI